jgi:hypothetical protein
MNLLRVLTLVGMAVFLLLLVPATARATDHPWDDNNSDSARVQGQFHNVVVDDSGAAPRPFIDTPVISKVADWWRGILRDVRRVFNLDAEQVVRPKSVNPNRRPDPPVVTRKQQ